MKGTYDVIVYASGRVIIRDVIETRSMVVVHFAPFEVETVRESGDELARIGGNPILMATEPLQLESEGIHLILATTNAVRNVVQTDDVRTLDVLWSDCSGRYQKFCDLACYLCQQLVAEGLEI